MKVALLTTDNRQNDHDYSAAEPRFGTAPAALLEGFATIPDLQVHVVCCTQQPIRSPEKIADNIWYHSLHVPKIGWLRTGYQGCIRAVRRKLASIQPDIVHGQGTERDCSISAVFSGFPNVITIHGNIRLIAKINRSRPFSFLWLAAQLETFTLPRADGVICLTHYTRQNVEALTRRTWVLPNAVHSSYFEVVRKRAALPEILCIGDITHRKNHVEFILALDELAVKHRFVVRFFGHTRTEPEYVARFMEVIKQRPWCRYEGFANRAVLQSALSTATMLALPSLEENCPMSVLEAMAAGVPTVAARVGGVPDIVENHVTGLVCEPLDRSTMREAVATYLANPAAANLIASEAKTRAVNFYHPKAIARHHVEIYRELLSKVS